MDLLQTAVVDIVMLVTTCHALKSSPLDAEEVLQPKLRKQVRRDIKRGTISYIETLSRSRRGTVDAALLVKCRVAAEQQMPRALEHQEFLGRIMAHEPGALDGLAAARQDLWRLAHVAVHLSAGMAAIGASAALTDTKAADSLATRLRRRVRKALVAYARALLRTKASRRRPIYKARDAALAEMGPRGVAEAERLADIEVGVDPSITLIRQGVMKPLHDLALDWQCRER